MEDEDGESRSTDMWPVGERVLRDPALGNSLKHSNDDEAYIDVITDDRQLQKHYKPIAAKDLPARDTVAGPRLTFKGFKKRILAEAQERHSAALRNSALEQQQLTCSNASTKSGGKERRAEGKHKITEYLGLQPSSRHKCSKCHGWLNCGSNSKQNLCVCNPSMTPMPSTSESASLPHTSSNFKITRKVYLCAACGTYFENWNLFLHMRDIHKRHICLFCLGMFGQAERLLHHLSKKHNVPDLEFGSEDEFYSVFKGSCYLVCCSCERIFSETDNFYDHFCSPTFKQDATAGMSVCTLCRQTGTHASTCNFALSSDADRESYTSTTSMPIVADSTRADDSSPATVPSPEKIVNLGGKGLPRKMMKNNRSKHGAEVMQNSHQPKSNSLARKLGARGRCNKNQLQPDVQRELVNNLPRDTVSETIMEVSRYTGDSSDENDENDEQAMNKDVSRDKGTGEKSPAQNHQLDCNEPYDSVTETIMEVSRCTSDTEEEDTTEKINPPTSTPDVRSLHATEKKTINEEEMDISDADPMNQSSSPKAPTPIRCEFEETATADRKAAAYELGTEPEFQPYDSPQNARSPVNRSLFSPRHESQTSDPQPQETESSKDDFRKEAEEKDRSVGTNASESQLSVSFNAVPSSDRSLVIKICTNRNSQFSVTSAAAVSRGSEENNNAEGSTTSKEKLANGSDRQKNVVDDDQANDLDDSDSDSDKLAVVDSNPEEDEEAEDGEEGEEAEEADEIEETEGRPDDTIRIESQEQEEIGTGMFDVVETDVLSGDATEKLDSNGTERTNSVKMTNNHEAKDHTSDDDGITLAGEDALCMDLNVEGTLDSMELDELLKRCIEAASSICVYCNHARCIAVNGKQLGLHMLAEHKFQPQHPAIIIHAEQFTARVKRSLDELEQRYFNLNTYDSVKGTYNVPQVRMYECFHCRFHSTVHKELYLHNRKMHQKTILICIMCKSTFYSYSELLCHLCPGVYSPNMNLRYRCCLCSVNSLPSSFRLMVHLRKQHHACDVCLESTGNQQRLSNHVWKHKLHHLCYRCGIAYRNKPDITKHLFWKHGTESVLCRKCVQKKWPHIYHFCIPPAEFKCDECESKFKRAVALKVHKRLHSTNLPYGCDECTKRFISRKLLAKHQASHKEPEPEEVDVNVTDVDEYTVLTYGLNEKSDKDKAQRTGTTANEGAVAGTAQENVKDVKEAVKRVVDVYDLPPLNLSSESDTDSDEEKVATAEKSVEKEKVATEDAKTEKNEETVEEEAVDDNAALVNDIVDVERNEEEKKQEARIMDGIWDNFKTYAASLEMKESVQSFALKESSPEADPAYLRSIVLADHDYCVVWSENGDQAASKEDDGKEEQDDAKSRKSPSPGGSPSRNASCESDATKRAKVKSPKKKKRSGSTSSSDSSSDTDSSSCSCGTNCSCSSSSSGSSSSSSSSSDSDSSTSESSPRKQSNRRERSKKEKENVRENKSESVEPENKEEVAIENGIITVDDEMVTKEPALPLMRESDLETDETVTDEDFYDEHPQLLANTLLAEKRNQLLLLATVSTSVEQRSTPLNNGVPEVAAETTTSIKPITMTVEDRPQQKRRTKTKKRRKGEKGNKRNATAAASATNTVESIKLNIPKAYYQKNPGFAASSPAVMSSLNPSRSSTPNLPVCNDLHAGAVGGTSMNTMEMLQTLAVGSATLPVNSNQNVGGSGSETENKRSSKRKRVPKRFYGDSSDDEPQEKQHVTHKWGRRTVETIVPTFAPPPPMPVSAPLPMTTSTPVANPKSIPPSRLSFGNKITQQTYRPGQMESQQQTLPQQQALPVTLASATESEGAAETSSESSESEMEADDSVSQRRTYNDLPPTNETTPAAERQAKIYCYCRCPYDEVSEMIACDGEDCRIEWFHFECVGIMVPPKGKWYCPDCRRKHNITQNNDEYCD